VLYLNDKQPDMVMISWAIRQLEAMRSPEAHRELVRFKAEIDRLPEDSPARGRLLSIESDLKIALRTEV
jgi:hypothetical protein